MFMTAIQPAGLRETRGVRGAGCGFVLRGTGFTLIELLVVISILTLLLAILLPSLKSARDRAYAVQCQNGLRQLYIGAVAFSNDHADYMPAYDIWGYVSGRRGFTSVDSKGLPTNAYNEVDQYFNYRRGSQYDYGPLTGSIYFCTEFQRRWSALAAMPVATNYSLGYVALTKYNNGPLATCHWDGVTLYAGDRLSSIINASFTIYMREFNIPDTMDPNMAGLDLWPQNSTTGAVSPYATTYSQIHLGGQNVSFFDGHTEYDRFPNNVKCQTYPGNNYMTYSTFGYNSYLWP
ncbi:MAG: prepilin-type N-terminal cleavage/methylation domain-containing protein [Phycisphaeraceae bacterium]|nr:prepilin-type N-terminal cleavage/methylation domain-containing protein [Phycisphaeraceae bacterium]